MKGLKNILLIAATAMIAFSCENWTETEQARHTELTGTNKPETFFENLRQYKASDHAIAFGWFGGWSASGSASLLNSLKGLPDSVDVVSIWGGWDDMTADKKADLEYVQKRKGTKVLACFIVHNVGDQFTPTGETAKDYWGWDGEWVPEKRFTAYTRIDSTVTASQEAIIRKYAKQIVDMVNENGYDGFDIDYEPNYQGNWGSLASYPKRMSIFIDEMSKYLGPKSGTGKLLVLDGEPNWMPAERGECMDYFIVQAYNCPGDADLDERLASTISNFDGVIDAETVAKKYVVTEDFEKYSQTGGYSSFYDRYGNKMYSVEGMARWTPIVNGKPVRKGGVGTYHMEYEYSISGKEGTYPALRNAIRIMNPPVK